MTENYFSDWELQRIYDLADYDIDEAYNKTLLYIEKYPEDIFARIHIAQLKYSMNSLDFEKYLYQLEDYFLKNYNNKENYRFFRAYVELEILKIQLAYLKGDYQRAYNLYLKNKVECDKKEKFAGYILCLRKKLGLLENGEEYPDFYYFSQVLDYDEKRFLEHIKKHLLKYSNSENIVFELGLFNEDFPLEEVLGEIKRILPNETKILQRTGEDLYCFKYDNCGRHKYALTDYFCLVTLHNSLEFITMYPTVDCNKKYCIDLNYLNKDFNDLKSSYNAVEKFNRRLSKFKDK